MPDFLTMEAELPTRCLLKGLWPLWLSLNWGLFTCLPLSWVFWETHCLLWLHSCSQSPREISVFPVNHPVSQDRCSWGLAGWCEQQTHALFSPVPCYLGLTFISPWQLCGLSEHIVFSDMLISAWSSWVSGWEPLNQRKFVHLTACRAQLWTKLGKWFIPVIPDIWELEIRRSRLKASLGIKRETLSENNETELAAWTLF
jgi:hypothetical protein